MSQRGLTSAVLLTILTVASLFTLTGYQLTTPSTGTKLQSRIAAAVLEIDRWLPAHAEDLNLLATDRPDSLVRVGDIPVPVTLPASRVVDAPAERLRSLILDEMGRLLYLQGTSAFRDSEGAPSSPSFTEPVYWAVFFVSRDLHSLWRIALPFAAVLALGAAALTLQSGRNVFRYIAVGAALSAVLSAAAIGAAIVVFGAFTSPVDHEIGLIVRDGALLGVRNSLAVLVVSVVATVLLRFVRPSSSSSNPVVLQESWPARPPGGH